MMMMMAPATFRNNLRVFLAFMVFTAQVSQLIECSFPITTTNNNNELENISCNQDSDCDQVAADSECNIHSHVCTCKKHTYAFNKTECLGGQLLTFPCKMDSQCQGRVANSLCVAGYCSCKMGTVAFRRHSCMQAATLGSICYSDDQCQLNDINTFCDFILKGVFGKCRCLYGDSKIAKDQCEEEFSSLGSPCFKMGPCKGLSNSRCVPGSDGIARCECNPDFQQINEKTCVQVKTDQSELYFLARIKESLLQSLEKSVRPVSLGYSCSLDGQCQGADPASKCIFGVCSCAFNKGTSNRWSFLPRLSGLFRPKRDSVQSEWFCSPQNIRLCPQGTFQCRSDGRCISRYFVCDGHAHCADNSDEDCGESFNCPNGSFTCPRSGQCLHVGRVCNGRPDCLHGEDEAGCRANVQQKVEGTACPKTSFQCLDGSKCVPGFEICNAHIGCPDGSDESDTLCRPTWTRSGSSEPGSDVCPFRCANGKCRSIDTLCSGSDGCGDNSDEHLCQICKCPLP